MSDDRAIKSILTKALVRYTIAVAAVASAFLLREAAVHYFDATLPPFILFYPAVMSVALLCGLWPGLLTTVLASLVVNYWILAPRGSFAIAGTSDAIALALFFGMGIFLSLVAEANRRNQRRVASFKREQALCESQENIQQAFQHHRLALEAAQLGAWDYRFDAGEVFWDERSRNLFGVATGDHFDYDACIDRIHCDDRPTVDEAVRQAIAGANDGVYFQEFRVVWADGSIHWVSSHGRVHFDGERRAVRFLGVNLDITERKQTEEVLRRFELMAKHTRDIVLFMRFDDGRILEANEAAADAYGYTREKLRSMTIHELREPCTRAQASDEMALADKRGILFESIHQRADGTVFPVEVSSQGTNIAGTRTLISIIRDITERKRAESVLQTTLQRFYLILSNMYSGVLLVTDEGRIEFANQAFCDRFGLVEAPADLVGLSRGEMLDKLVNAYRNPEEALTGIQRVVDRGEPVGGEETAMQNDRTFLRDFVPLKVGGESYGRLWIHTDISDRKQVEEALRSSQAKLQSIVGSAMDAVISVDEHKHIIVFNRAAETIFQCVAAEALGSTLDRFIPEALRAIHCEHMRLFGSQGTTARSMTAPGVLTGVRTNGEEFPMEATISQVQANGEKIYTVILRDITVRKRAEEALQQSEAQFRTLADAIPQLCWMANPDGWIFWYNERWYEYTGTTPEQMEGWAWQSVHDPETLPKVLEQWTASIATGAPFDMVFPLRGADGVFRPFLTRVMPVKDEEGKVVRWFGTNTDISAQKLAEDALRESEERWETTLQSIGDAVISTDSEGKIQFMNGVGERLTGWSLPEARGKDLSEVFDIVQETTRIKPESPVAKVLRSGQVVGLANHTALIRRDGTEVPIEDSAAPIRNRSGQIDGVVLVFHDVIEQRNAEKALRISDRLATTGRLAATIAHEIHNPLDAIGNLLYLIDQDTQEQNTRDFAAMASRELVRVTQMTRRMLAFQRESAKPIPVEIREILASVIELYERKFKSSEIHFVQRIDIEGHILALPGELRQMFANIVGNAIEAVAPQKGKITLRAYASRDWQSQRRGVRVVIADNGPGIPSDVCARIFEPFFTTKGESGTGLGLWIASDILHKYDGVMKVRTSTRSRGSGTCFSIFLPFEVSSDLRRSHASAGKV